jgi:hypothetical protein
VRRPNNLLTPQVSLRLPESARPCVVVEGGMLVRPKIGARSFVPGVGGNPSMSRLQSSNPKTGEDEVLLRRMPGVLGCLASPEPSFGKRGTEGVRVRRVERRCRRKMRAEREEAGSLGGRSGKQRDMWHTRRKKRGDRRSPRKLPSSGRLAELS